jgi:poly(3-hydroxybutyrate) depolymerase
MLRRGKRPTPEGTILTYQAYEVRRSVTSPVYRTAALVGDMVSRLPQPAGASLPIRLLSAWSQTVSALQVTHARPAFGIDSVEVAGETITVSEDTVFSTPFASLLRFAKPVGADQPRVLILPGLAGHFATLVRDTVATMLPDHDVYVADWHNARDVPVDAGRFGLDEFTEHIMVFLREIGPGTHLVAICQPCAAALAAAALMAEDRHPAEPRSLVLMSGPVDARVNPGAINRYSDLYPAGILERSVITTVPKPYAGHGRRVYPGFLQLAGFMGLDPARHASAFARFFLDIAAGREPSERTRPFYEEFFAVLDIAAEFYLDTARMIFRDHDLARGELRWRGRRVDPSVIRSALLSVEGENDELCPPGQTRAAHALCTGIPAGRKRHHLQKSVGHYGVFNGSNFRREIYPQIRGFIAEMSSADYDEHGREP